jgi:hypothetical protein
MNKKIIDKLFLQGHVFYYSLKMNDSHDLNYYTEICSIVVCNQYHNKEKFIPFNCSKLENYNIESGEPVCLHQCTSCIYQDIKDSIASDSQDIKDNT